MTNLKVSRSLVASDTALTGLVPLPVLDNSDAMVIVAYPALHPPVPPMPTY